MQASHSISVKNVLIQTLKGCIKRLKLVGNQHLTFTKAVGSDWALAANQDFLTSNVIITRVGLGNFLTSLWRNLLIGAGGSPIGTEWAVGGLLNL